MSDFFIAVGIFALALICIPGCMADESQWQEFKKQHHCRLVSEHDGKTALGVGSKGGLTTVFVPGEECFSCDDGVEYCR